MKARYLCAPLAAVFVTGSLVAFAYAQQQPAQAAQVQAVVPLQGYRTGSPVFQQNCGTCHTFQGRDIDGRAVPSLPALQQYSPERVYQSLITGTMKEAATQLTDVQKRQISEFVAGRPIGSASGDAQNMPNRCATNPQMADPSAGPAWNGWGTGAQNSRFQSTSAAGLTAAQVPGLKVKWAFGVPNALEMPSQPTVASGRVFFGSNAAVLYSLDAKTGCIYWSFNADSGIRAAPIVAPIRGQGTTRYAVYFTDVLTRLYALDAQTGKLLWNVRTGDHPAAQSTGSPTLYDGRLYVPLSSTETPTGAVLAYQCCTFRGHVTAVDANTGQRVWTTYVIQEEPKVRGQNKQGVTLWGPAGGAVWNAPTIDAKRRRLYVGTGNAYTFPAARGTDSIIAMDLDTGKILWQHQEVQNDAFIGNCPAVGLPGDNCPETLGPDYDFGGASMLLYTLPDGRDVLVGGSKGGISIALDLDKNGAVVWKTSLSERPPAASGLIVFGGASDGNTAYYGMNQPGGGVTAVRLADGSRSWTRQKLTNDDFGLSAAVTAIPGAIFTSTRDGILWALSAADGRVLWQYNTAREYEAINGVAAKGGALGAPGPTIAGGMMFVGSGYVGAGSRLPGNALIAFGPE
jgi:polyvinyl alcohol dehydrogenase (cytochrome)